MTNFGEIYASKEGVDGSVATFDNHGSIWGFRSGIFLVGGSVVNAPGAAISGRSEEAINIGVVDNPVEVSLFNAGVLTRQSASSFFDDASVSGSAGKVEVTNTGLIVGDISMFGAAQDTVMNRGEIVGDVKTCNSTDVVMNRGIVTGDVVLGGGADRFDGRKGDLDGSVTGGKAMVPIS